MPVADVAIAADAVGRRDAVTSEPRWVRLLLIALTLLFLAFFLLLPLVVVFVEALKTGIGPYFAALGDRDALAAINMTLLVAAIAVPANLIFGIAAAWCVAKFDFKGKSILITLIDLPFSVSPV